MKYSFKTPTPPSLYLRRPTLPFPEKRTPLPRTKRMRSWGPKRQCFWHSLQNYITGIHYSSLADKIVKYARHLFRAFPFSAKFAA